jgi:hypothetical protein
MQDCMGVKILSLIYLSPEMQSRWRTSAGRRMQMSLEYLTSGTAFAFWGGFAGVPLVRFDSHWIYEVEVNSCDGRQGQRFHRFSIVEL